MAIVGALLGKTNTQHTHIKTRVSDYIRAYIALALILQSPRWIFDLFTIFRFLSAYILL